MTNIRAPKKYYYEGYECLATFQAAKNSWLCAVENVTEPFEFDVDSEQAIQGAFEYQIQQYRLRCDKAGILPRKARVSMHGGRKGIDEQDRERKQRAAKKEAEFNKSYLSYISPLYLMGLPALGFAILMSLGKIFPFTIFFPYRANVTSHRLPVITILVCVVCAFVFMLQLWSDNNYIDACQRFTQKEEVVDYVHLLDSISDYQYSQCSTLAYLRRIKYPESAIREMATEIRQHRNYHAKWQQEEIESILDKAYRSYTATVPESVTEIISFKSNRFDVIGTYTSQFAHASWGHIIFNLVFFFAFAASVELLAGHVFFLVMFVITPIIMAMFYSDSFVIAGNIHGNGGLGLSGMCYAFLGALLVLKPKIEIKTFFWFLIKFRTYSVPIWFLAVWWVSGDVGAIMSGRADGVNHIAHFSGACTGALLALAYRIMNKQMNHQVLEEEAQ